MFTSGLFIEYTVGLAATMLFMLGLLRWVERKKVKEEKFDINKLVENEIELLKKLRKDKGKIKKRANALFFF